LEVTAVLEKEADEIKNDWGQIKNILSLFSETKHQEQNNDSLLHEIRQCLLGMEIDGQIVDSLLENIDLNSGKDVIRQELENRLMSIFKPVIPNHHQNKIMVFVGAPGVGKTTTLAKIGAIFSLFNSFNISFITIDTYRVGAIEQMKIYGDIIGASVDVVMSPEELKEVVEKNKDKDLILIDTTGRPSKNFHQLTELRTFLDVLDYADIYLVINATTQKKDMMHILNDYKITDYSQLIITKIDETVAPGSIINAAYYTGLPIAYITNGQDVPDDIEVSSPKLLAGYVMRDVVF
jgi:flagellar biosynthesis protein FlhF